MVLKQGLIVPILISAFFIQGVCGTDISISSGGSGDAFASNTRYIAGNDADLSSIVALDPVNGNSLIQSAITGTDDANLKWSIDNGNCHAETGFNLKSNGGIYNFRHNQGLLSGGRVYADLTLNAKGVSNIDAWSYANTKFADAATGTHQELIARASIQVEDSPDDPNSVNINGYYTKATAGPDYVSAHQEIMDRPPTSLVNTNKPQYKSVPKIEGSKIAIDTYAEQYLASDEPPQPTDFRKWIESYSTATGDGSKFTAYNADVYSSKANDGYLSVNSLKAESPLGNINQGISIDVFSPYWGDYTYCRGGTEVSRGYIDGYQARTDDSLGWFETKQNPVMVNGDWRVYTGMSDSLFVLSDEKSGSGPTVLKSQAIVPSQEYLPKVTIIGSYIPGS